MYCQANYGQGSQPPRAPPPYQHGPQQYPPRFPVPISPPLQHSSHFGAHNVNQNSSNLPPPPPLPHGTGFHQVSNSAAAPLPYGGSGSEACLLQSPMSLCSPSESKRSGLVSADDNEGSQPGAVSSLNGSEATDSLPRFETMEARNRGKLEELGTSNADSDMEMEDDITLTDNNLGTYKILSNAKGTGEEDSINALQILVERGPVHLNPSGNLGSASTPTLEVHDADVVLSGAKCPLDNPIGTIASENFNPADTSLNADTSNAKRDLELIKVANPMRLLQDYASDDNSENGGDLLPKDTRSSLEVDKETKSQDNKIKGKLRSEIFSESNAYHKIGEGFSTSRRDIKAYNRVYISTGRAGECKDTDGENQNSTRDGTSYKGFLEKDMLDESGARETSKRYSGLKESEEKKVQSEATSIKVDEFGRLLKEASDSDSDSGLSNRNERRKRKYVNRSRSRSRSPKDRRRKTISRRRDYERSRSRSRSPRKRRSRSRSPKNRRTSQFSAGKFRSNGKQGSECFLFLQGRCLRGASCRYMHHKANRSDSSRSYRNTQKHPEIRSETQNRNTKNETKRSPIKQPEHMHHETVKEIKEGVVDQKKEDNIMYLDYSDELVKCQSLGEVKIVMDNHGTSQAKSHMQLFTDTPNFMVKQPQSTLEDLNLVCPAPGQVYDPSELFTPPNQTAVTSPKNIPTTESAPNNMLVTSSSQQPLPYRQVTELPSAKVLFPPSYPHPINSREPSQLPPPPPIPISHGANTLHMQHMPMGYNPVPHAVSYPPQFTHPRNPHPYPQFSVPPNFGWNLPPPPPRPPCDIRFMHSASSQFEPAHFPPRNDFGSHNPARNPEFLHVSHLEPPQQNLQLQNSVPGNLRSQFEESGLPRDGRFSHHAVQESSAANSLGPVNLHEQPVLSSEQATGNLHQQLSGPSKERSESSAEAHYSSHTQQAFPPIAEDRLSMPGKSGAGPQYLQDPEENNNLANGSDFGLPRIIPHHNPYASTFEQPLGSRFCPNFSRGMSRNQYDITSRHVAVNEQGVGDYGYSQTTPSPSAARDGQNIMPGQCGEQYNPLVDSLEPTSSAKRMDGRSRNWGPTSDSYPMECPSGSSNKPMDVHEIARHEVLAEASTTSLDNDEFGETAEREVGAVDNESLSDLAGVTNAAEIESESKSPVEERSDKKKRKKKKDSRSAKPFKMAIAEFVKDVLKPSWRQGNMSKEAFKTIVKKTVDRVSVAMKGHIVPKSQSKIDQYIESSQRKLTKLVMGYVDKYVKG